MHLWRCTISEVDTCAVAKGAGLVRWHIVMVWKCILSDITCCAVVKVRTQWDKYNSIVVLLQRWWVNIVWCGEEAKWIECSFESLLFLPLQLTCLWLTKQWWDRIVCCYERAQSVDYRIKSLLVLRHQLTRLLLTTQMMRWHCVLLWKSTISWLQDQVSFFLWLQLTCVLLTTQWWDKTVGCCEGAQSVDCIVQSLFFSWHQNHMWNKTCHETIVQ